jgi:hypothetical protein
VVGGLGAALHSTEAFTLKSVLRSELPDAILSTVSYNASAVKIYNATNSIPCLKFLSNFPLL